MHSPAYPAPTVAFRCAGLARMGFFGWTGNWTGFRPKKWCAPSICRWQRLTNRSHRPYPTRLIRYVKFPSIHPLLANRATNANMSFRSRTPFPAAITPKGVLFPKQNHSNIFDDGVPNCHLGNQTAGNSWHARLIGQSDNAQFATECGVGGPSGTSPVCAGTSAEATAVASIAATGRSYHLFPACQITRRERNE